MKIWISNLKRNAVLQILVQQDVLLNIRCSSLLVGRSNHYLVSYQILFCRKRTVFLDSLYLSLMMRLCGGFPGSPSVPFYNSDMLTIKIFLGSSSRAKTSQALLQMAVYIANTFYLTSDSIVPLMRDKDLVNERIHNHNLIIVGDLSATASYLKKVELTIEEDQSVSLGKFDSYKLCI